MTLGKWKWAAKAMKGSYQKKKKKKGWRENLHGKKMQIFATVLRNSLLARPRPRLSLFPLSLWHFWTAACCLKLICWPGQEMS